VIFERDVDGRDPFARRSAAGLESTVQPSDVLILPCALRVAVLPRRAWRAFRQPAVAEGSNLFPLLGALLCCRLASFCALGLRLAALRSLGLLFRFLFQRTIARGFAGGGRRADTRHEMKILAVRCPPSSGLRIL
jgi:hypothetical protein